MAGTSNLPAAGVEAIVEGLNGFASDMRKMNSSINSLTPGTTLLQRAFTSAWEAVGDFGREVLNVAEYALGKILADALEWVIGKLGELVSATFEAGSEFQTLELRLNRLNFNTLIESGMDYTQAGREAVQITKEQLDWLQKLAAATPYDNTDISNVYTLARSYGFADQQARGLTEDISNFAAGMGLGNTEIERIIVNFGQMVQQGKVTQREMNDLARGAFVPVNDVLEQMSKDTGIAMDEMDDFRKTAESVPAFMKAFSEVVATRFAGAAEQMAKTFKAASDNAMDIVKSIGGLNVVKPILDVVGERIAAFTSAFTENPERWDRMVDAASRVGDALADIVDGLFDLLPTSESLADSAVSAVEGIATWLEEHGPGIKKFFEDLGTIVGGVTDKIGIAISVGKPEEKQQTGPTGYFPGADVAMQQKPEPFGGGILETAQKIADFINDKLIPAFIKIQVWFEVNKPLIDEFWGSVWEIIGSVISDITGAAEGGGTGFLTTVTTFMQYVVDHKDAIAEWASFLLKAFVVWQLLTTAWVIAAGVLIKLITAFFMFKGVLALVTSVALWALIAGIALAVEEITGLLGAIENIKERVSVFVEDWKTRWEEVATAVKDKNWAEVGMLIVMGIESGIASLLEIAINILTVSFPTRIRDEVRSWDWYGVGKSVIDGIIRGLMFWVPLIDAIRKMVSKTESTARETLEANSPSRLFERVGRDIISGMINGIKNGITGLITAARDAARSAYEAAMDALGAHSPSKLFMELGGYTMEGFAEGIEKAAGVAVSAMQSAVGQVAMPAISSMAAAQAGGNTVTNNRTANLTINSSAPVEPVVQDFNMMASILGA